MRMSDRRSQRPRVRFRSPRRVLSERRTENETRGLCDRLCRVEVLGIDAGGTKTVCQLVDDQTRVLAETRGPGANLQASGELEVEKVLHQVIDAALARRTARPEAICLGMAGVDRPRDADVIRG